MTDGVSRCAHYAFGPNRLHMCGPDANREVLVYLNEGVADGGLTHLLAQFKTLFPYLETIAHANRVDDVFDPRVVEAYWLGNKLLDSIQPQTFYRHLTDNLQLKKHLAPHTFNALENKLNSHPAPHHNFHVFNVWKRTGHVQEEHTLESMDQCRISWGKVTAVEGPFLTVERQPLMIGSPPKKGETAEGVSGLTLGSPVHAKITRRLEDNSLMEDVVIGDVISIHWGMPCEILTPKQLMNLKRYTTQSLTLAHITL